MWAIPDVADLDKDPEHAYQGVGVRNLEQAILQGWKPVEEKEKVGTNWPVGPNGFRMFQEQVLCKMPMARWEALQQDIDSMKEALSIETAEKQYREQVGEENAYGSIRDG
jgi:hypothetical protein